MRLCEGQWIKKCDLFTIRMMSREAVQMQMDVHEKYSCEQKKIPKMRTTDLEIWLSFSRIPRTERVSNVEVLKKMLPKGTNIQNH